MLEQPAFGAAISSYRVRLAPTKEQKIINHEVIHELTLA